MDAFASPSIRSAGPARAALRLAETVVMTLAIGLTLMSMPGHAEANLDGSWQEMLIHAHYQGLQFGRDLIFTWGPWGFLCTGFQMGSLGAVPILIWQTAGQLGIALALVTLIRDLAGWRRAVFAAALVAFHWLFLDTVYFVLITLITLGGLMKRDTTVVRLVAWTLVLGFLAQLKFTYLVVSAAGVVASAACWGARRDPGRTLAVTCGFALGIVAAWCAAGQNLDNLYPYVRRSLEISAGYGDAMGLDETFPQFGWGAAIACVCALFTWQVWLTVPERALGRSAAGFLAFVLFVMWKESFTRADIVPLGGHIFGFFSYVVILSSVAGGFLFPARRWHGFDGAMALCLLGLAAFDPQYYQRFARVEWERIYGNGVALKQLPELPSVWQESYEEACAANALPAIQAAVGAGTVDVYDYRTGIAFLNGLELSARPIFQSYSAYTPSLEGWNLRFFQSAQAPDFLLWDGGRVDNRYPGEDDAMLVASLPGHFDPVLSEGGYWLFKKRSPIGTAPQMKKLILSRTVHLSEVIPLPAEQSHAIWLQADAVPNALGRARALLYKPAIMNIVTTDELDTETTWRFLPRVAHSGFLLVPTLTRGEDLVALMRGETSSRVSAIRFEAPEGQGEFWSHIDVQLSSLPGLPLNQPSNFWLQELGIVDRPPISIVSIAQPDVIDVPEGKALLLHAVGEIVFGVPAGAARFTGSFGLRAGAYTDGGHTAGVDFEVDAVDSSGRRVKLWSRYLDPVNREEDRGTQHFDVALPDASPARLILRTGTGPDNINSWDWSYVAALRFEGP